MKTPVTTIIRDVETALNEVDPNEASFVGDKDNADLEVLIESKIEAAVDRLHRESDLSRLSLDAGVEIHYKNEAGDPRFRYKASTGVLSLLLQSHTPSFTDTFDIDLLRMVTARSASWPFAVHNVVYPDDPLYEIVTDKYVGAQSDFPAVTLQKRRIAVDGTRAVVTTLDLRCLGKESDWATVSLIPRAKITDGQVDIDSGLYHELVRLVAAETRQALTQ